MKIKKDRIKEEEKNLKIKLKIIEKIIINSLIKLSYEIQCDIHSYFIDWKYFVEWKSKKDKESRTWFYGDISSYSNFGSLPSIIL